MKRSCPSPHDQSTLTGAGEKLRCSQPECQNRLRQSHEYDFRTSELADFLSIVCCQGCSTAWTVCLACPSNTSKYKTTRQIKDHLRHVHKEHHESNRSRKRRFDNVNVDPASPLDVPTDTFGTRETHPGYGDSLPSLLAVGLPTSQLPNTNIPGNGALNAPDSFQSLPEMDDETDNVSLNDNVSLHSWELPVYTPKSPLIGPTDITAANRDATREFFFRNQKGEGSKYLAAKAQFGLSNIDPTLLDSLEVRMLMQTAELAASMPRADSDRLADYTKTVAQVVKKQTLEEIELQGGRTTIRPWTILPVTSRFQMRRQMRDGSKDAIINNVPHVAITSVGCHAVTLPSDCLQDLAGHGFPLAYVPNSSESLDLPTFPVNSISTTGMCKKLFDINDLNPTPLADYNIWIFEWSDDFEPNSSLTKSSRGGVWVKTITLGPPGTHAHLPAYTYAIAMGPKNANHEEAERVIAEDLRTLSQPEGIIVYSKAHGGLVRIRAKIIACLQDQPERRGENGLTGGGSDFHRRFGYSFPWQDFETELRLCPGCREVLFDESKPWVCPTCEGCTNFAHHLQHPLLHYSSEGGCDDLFGSPEGVLKLSYPILAEAVNLAHDGYVSGEWEALDVLRWLKMHCINLKTSNLILSHADKCKEYQDIFCEGSDSSDALKTAVQNEKDRRPSLYLRWPLPSLWTRGVHLNQYPCVPMHLLFLGVVKTVIFRIQKWMTRKCKGKPFMDQMRGYLESIQELHLSWCPVRLYNGGKFGGWVSENYLALSRVLKWFYSVLDKIAPGSEPWAEPQRATNEWTGEDCKEWMKMRGLEIRKLAAERRSKVVELKRLPEVMQLPLFNNRVGQ